MAPGISPVSSLRRPVNGSGDVPKSSNNYPSRRSAVLCPDLPRRGDLVVGQLAPAQALAVDLSDKTTSVGHNLRTAKANATGTAGDSAPASGGAHSYANGDEAAKGGLSAEEMEQGKISGGVPGGCGHGESAPCCEHPKY